MQRLPFLVLFSLFIQFSIAQQRVVQKKYADGTPQVVYYYEPFFLEKALVKQEIFYKNGNLEYSGESKYGMEHGEWKYYYENGKMKAHEYWRYGKETGTWKEYDEKGKLIRSTEYKSGKKIKMTDH